MWKIRANRSGGIMGIKGIIIIVVIFCVFLAYHLPFLDIWYDKIKKFFKDEREDKIEQEDF